MNLLIIVFSAVFMSLFLTKKIVLPYIKQLKRLNRMAHGAISVEATIFDYKVDQNSDGPIHYLKVVEYNIDGVDHKVLIDNPVRERPIPGKRLRVLVDKEDHEFAVEDIFELREKYLLGLFFVVIMMILASIFIFLNLKYSKD